MNAVTLGPFILPLERLAGLVCLLVLIGGGWLLSRRVDKRFLRWGELTALAAAVGARLGFVALHWDAYAPRPWTVFYIWQGGFTWWAGAAAAALLSFLYFRESPRKLLWACLPLALSAAVWIGYRASTPQSPPPMPLPALTLPQLHGDPVKLSSLMGRPAVINLWATWCGPCRREMPLLAETARQRPDVVFIFANQSERAAAVETYLTEEALELDRVLLDTAGALGRHFNAIGMPTTLFFDAGGRLREYKVGELSAAELSHGLRRITGDLPASR